MKREYNFKFSEGQQTKIKLEEWLVSIATERIAEDEEFLDLVQRIQTVSKKNENKVKADIC